jgi:DNA replication protein DnaC
LIGYTALKLDLSAMYRKAFDVFLRIREGMKAQGDSEKKAIEEFTSPFFLVIDAYEVRSDSDFENRILDHIVDKRYDNMKSTLILSNDTVQNFEKQVGPSICDRIRETGGIVEMAWQSFRLRG